MTRLALVQVGEQFSAIRRIAPRLRGGQITAVVDSDAVQAQRFAKELEVSTWATSTTELHQHLGDKFDAWAAATSNGFLFASHNDRPLDMRPECWSHLPEGWMWGHVFRLLPSLRTLKESVDSGKLGDTGLVRIHHWQTKGADLRSSLLAQLDVACSLVGRSPAVIFGLSRAARRGDVGNEYLQVHIGFDDDRMAVIDCTTQLASGDDYYSAGVISSTGAAYADDHHNVQLLFGGQHPQAIKTSQGDRGLLATFQEFVDSRAKSRPPICGAPEWHRAQRLWNAAARSLQSGQSQKVAGESR